MKALAVLILLWMAAASAATVEPAHSPAPEVAVAEEATALPSAAPEPASPGPAKVRSLYVMAPPRIEPYVNAALDILKRCDGVWYGYVAEKIDIIFYGDWDNPRSEGPFGVAAYIAERPVGGEVKTIVGLPRYYDGALRDSAWTAAALIYESGRAHQVTDMDARQELAASAIRGIGACTSDEVLGAFGFYGH